MTSPGSAPWWLQFIGVALATAVTDVCWGKYAIATNAREPMPAALWSCGIVLSGSISIFAYFDDHRFVIASMLGAFIGTYMTVHRSSK